MKKLIGSSLLYLLIVTKQWHKSKIDDNFWGKKIGWRHEGTLICAFTLFFFLILYIYIYIYTHTHNAKAHTLFFASNTMDTLATSSIDFLGHDHHHHFHWCHHHFYHHYHYHYNYITFILAITTDTMVFFFFLDYFQNYKLNIEKKVIISKRFFFTEIFFYNS